MNVFLVFRILSNISSLILCWVGLRSFKTDSPVYARIFALLNIFEQVAEIILWAQADNENVQSIVNNAVVIAELVIYGFIFLKIIYSKYVRWVVVVLLSAIMIFYILYMINTSIFRRFPLGYQLYTYMIFLVPSFTYFREVFKFQKQVELIRDFTFWLVAGLTFYFAASIVINLGLYWLLTLNRAYHVNDFYVFSGIVFIFSNIIFIKAFLCLQKRR